MPECDQPPTGVVIFTPDGKPNPEMEAWAGEHDRPVLAVRGMLGAAVAEALLRRADVLVATAKTPPRTSLAIALRDLGEAGLRMWTLDDGPLPADAVDRYILSGHLTGCVYLYDRVDQADEDNPAAVKLRLERSRAWARERNIKVVDEYIAAGSESHSAELVAAITECRGRGGALVVWDAAVLGDGTSLRRYAVMLDGLALIEASTDRRVMPASERGVLRVPTGWQVVRWARGRDSDS